MKREWNVRRVKGNREYWYSNKNRMYVIKRDIEGVLPIGYKYRLITYYDSEIVGESSCKSVQEAKDVVGFNEYGYEMEE